MPGQWELVSGMLSQHAHAHAVCMDRLVCGIQVWCTIMVLGGFCGRFLCFVFVYDSCTSYQSGQAGLLQIGHPCLASGSLANCS